MNVQRIFHSAYVILNQSLKIMFRDHWIWMFRKHTKTLVNAQWMFKNNVQWTLNMKNVPECPCNAQSKFENNVQWTSNMNDQETF